MVNPLQPASVPSEPSADSGALVAFVLPDLRGGGAERVILQLAEGFVHRGFAVDIVVRSPDGPLLPLVPSAARLVNLGTRRMAGAVYALRRYGKRARPAAAISALTHTNLATLLAFAVPRGATNVVVTEHSHLSLVHAETRPGRSLLFPPLMRILYPRAAAVVAVSEGVAGDVRHSLGRAGARVTVVPNPVDPDELLRKAQLTTEQHAWLHDDGDPIVLAVGRLSADKGYETLLHTFATTRTRVVCRLLILGEGEDRAHLEGLAAQLGITEFVSLPGFTQNPYPYFPRASVFVLSSSHEGLPTSLLEAVALRVPCVSTDCPSGPAEILDGGQHGRLVKVEDADELAEALIAQLQDPHRPAEHAIERYHADSVLRTYVDLAGL